MAKTKKQQRVWMLRDGGTWAKRRAEELEAQRVTVRAMVLLDTEALREKAVKACSKAARDFENADRELKSHEQADIPAFERWKSQAFGPLLSQFQEVHAAVAEAGYFYDIAQSESYRTGLPPWEALQYWREDQERRKRNPKRKPEPPPDDFDFSGAPENDDEDFDEKMREFLKNTPLGKMAEELGIDLEDLDAWKFHEAQKKARGKNAAHEPQHKRENASVRDLYRQLCRLLHPDAAGEMTPERRAIWHQVQEAYEAGDAARLDTLLARVEQSDGLEIRPRTISEILDIKRHYERARQQLRNVLAGARRHPAWQFLKRDERSRSRLEIEIRREIEYALTDMRRTLKQMQAAIEPPPRRTPKRKTQRFDRDDLFD